VYVGSLRATFLIRGARSLKDRRRVIRSIKDRVRHRYPVSIAEVGDVELRQRAELGVAMVGNEHHHVEEVLHDVLRFFRGARDAELIDHELRML
jgi:uncharacterized protein YlxP (DUF503 family)